MKKLLTITLLLISGIYSHAQAQGVKIVALVNGEVISSEDVDNRVRAFSLTSGVPLNNETKDMMFQRVMHNAVDEKLKLQEAAKNDIIISTKELNDAIDSFEANNKMPKGELLKLLKQKNISADVFKKQIESDLAWNRLIRKLMASEALISQAEIEQTLDEAKKDLSTPKYLTKEIFIRKSKGKTLSDVKQLAEKIRQDPRFELYAMQFSDSPSASGGGDLGWSNKGSFDPKVEAALLKMREGQISNPIEVDDGYYIIFLVGSYDPQKDKTPEPTKEDIRKFLESKKLEMFSNKHIQNLRQKAIIEVRNM